MTDSFTDGQERSLRAAAITISSFSFIGSLFICICYLKFRDLRTFAFSLVFYMSISDAMAAIAQFLGSPVDGSGLCYLQSYMSMFFELSSILWSVSISFSIYRILKSDAQSIMIQNARSKYHFFVWGTAGFLTLLPQTTNSFGQGNGWCFIRGDKTGTLWRFLCFYVPLIICLVYVSYTGVLINRRFKLLQSIPRDSSSESESESENQTNLGTLKRMRYYPLGLIFCYFWAIINRTFQAANHGDPAFWLSVLHIIFSSSQGLVNAIIYGFTPAIKNKMAAILSDFKAETEVAFEDPEINKCTIDKTADYDQ